ncbi:MAG: hypothetical protein JO099_17730, partial [Acidobacteriia bacterium]|nr:hypothetical protein [Terriglobia bacterium]
KNLRLGTQATCCSNSILNSFEQYRQAGATARAMLMTAAARRWQVPIDEISVTSGVVEHLRSSRGASFGDLAVEAAWTARPASVALKDPKNSS